MLHSNVEKKEGREMTIEMRREGEGIGYSREGRDRLHDLQLRKVMFDCYEGIELSFAHPYRGSDDINRPLSLLSHKRVD